MTIAKTKGLDAHRLAHLCHVVKEDAEKGLYFGGVVVVARHGEVGMRHAFGWADEARTKEVKVDSVFSIFSVTKSLTTVLILRAIEHGQIGLTTPVKEVIPEWKGGLREKITLWHLLTHSSGCPSVYEAKSGMYIDRLDEVIAAIVENIRCEVEPGTRVDYSPLVGHALMGEMVRRLDPQKRSYRQIVQEELFDRLKMKDSSIGLRKDLKPRHLKPEPRGNFKINHLGHSNLGPNGAFEEEDAEMPWVGCASTAGDFHRFVEMLRRGGELDGERILGPQIIKHARTNQTGEMPNQVYKKLCEDNGWPVLPAYIGLGFPLRGEKYGEHYYGTLASPETFGAYGAGTTLIWVDPVLDMTFVGFTTGVMSPADNYKRWRRLCDIAVSAAV